MGKPYRRRFLSVPLIWPWCYREASTLARFLVRWLVEAPMILTVVLGGGFVRLTYAFLGAI
jgi:hypothetical protein